MVILRSGGDYICKGGLWKPNFTTIPQNSASGTSQQHSLWSGIAEAELCIDIHPRAELLKRNFAKTLSPEGNCRSGTSQGHFR